MFKKLLSQTALYGISSIIGRFLNYLLVPFYIQYFEVGQYGQVTKLYAYIAFLNVIFTYGMETAFFRFSTKNKENQQDIYNSAISLLLISTLVFTAGLYIAAPHLANLIGIPGKIEYIQWTAFILATDTILCIPFAKLRLDGNAKLFASAKIINILLNIGLNIFLIKFLKIIDPGMVLLANLIANALIIPLLNQSFIKFRFTFKSQFIKPMLVYAWPLLFLGLAGMTNEVLDRILLEYLLPNDVLSKDDRIGIYGACYKLSIFMSLAVQAFRYAAEPFFFSKAEDKNAPQTFARVMNWFVIVCALIFLFVSVNLPIVEWIFVKTNKSVYVQGLMIVPVLLLANLFLGVYYNLSIWYKLADKTYFGTIITCIGAAITLVSLYLLIPIFGILGAAYATLICYFSITCISYIWGNKHYPIPYQLSKIGFYIILAVVFVFIHQWFHIQSLTFNLLVANSLVVFYLIIIVLNENLFQYFNKRIVK